VKLFGGQQTRLRFVPTVPCWCERTVIIPGTQQEGVDTPGTERMSRDFQPAAAGFKKRQPEAYSLWLG
jgi:hypothetical protein